MLKTGHMAKAFKCEDASFFFRILTFTFMEAKTHFILHKSVNVF